MMSPPVRLIRPSLDDLREWLATCEWQSTFDGRTLVRGREYARRDHVIESHLENASETRCVLAGMVEGTRSDPYGVTITIQRSDSRLILDAECSCPGGTECKHAAALLFHLLGDAPRAAAEVPATTPTWLDALIAHEERRKQYFAGDYAADEWGRWLDNLSAGYGTPEVAVVEAGRTFALLLHAEGERTSTLHVVPAWLRPGKTRKTAETLVDPIELALRSRGPEPTPAGGWPANDLAALAVLLGATHAYLAGRNWLCVDGVHAENALMDLAGRHPVLLHGPGNPPITLGAARPLRWAWTAAADGSQRLVASVDLPGATLLRSARLWYLDRAQHQFGPVDAAPQLAALVDKLPDLPPARANQVRERLAAITPTLPLPAPRSAPRVVRADPVPVLAVRTFPWGALATGSMDSPTCARLRFDYGGILVDATEPEVVQRMRGDQLYEIHRDFERETRAVVQLRPVRLNRAGWLAPSNAFGPDRLRSDDLVYGGDYRYPSKSLRGWAPVIDKLAAKGFRIDYADNCPHQDLAKVDAWHGELAPAGNAWFDVTLGIDVAGERVDLMPILRSLLRDPAFPLVAPKRESKNATWHIAVSDTRAIELPLARLRTLIDPLLEWLLLDEAGEPRVPHSAAEALAETGIPWHGDEALRAQLELLRIRQRKPVSPRTLKATLRPYQLDGLAWLDFLAEAKLGGILADDMGLGKTVQVLAHILAEKERQHLAEPVLVVCPTSLVGNWQAEAARFAPSLKVLALQGADRARHFGAIAAHDLIITTYPLLARDVETLVASAFSLLVLDEAQAIKNAASRAAKVVRKLHAARRLAMTGTPLENHLGELWAQFDAVEPGILGSARAFAKFYRTPIEKHGDLERQARLNRRIGALMLRRRKDDVLTYLPAKTEIVHTLELEADQRALYETLRLTQHERVRQAVAERGLARSGIVVLDALLKLRQACCDPRLVKLDSAKKVKASAKLDALMDLVETLLGDGRRILLFSQFTEMLALIEAALAKRKLAFQTLTGATPARERTALVKRFQQGDVPLFLISLKAGGTGLNLTAADTVIHYDPWWNPAVEGQATDRAHRLGQDKPVFVYRLICAGTVEEKIQAMQGRKAELARAVLEGGASQQLRFDAADLEALFGGR